MQNTFEKHFSWLDRPLADQLTLNWEKAIFAIILVLAIFSRFYILGERVMSHDENSHVYYSWRFYKGEGFAHDPLMHGPLQFHLIALSYFMFGDNDFTARIPSALMSIGTVAFMWAYRRYLGHAGALVAAVLMLISPYILYYGRYARNESLVAFFGVITLWALLRYLETGKSRYLYWFTTATVLHFTSKETSFIYTAQAMIFLAGYFVYRVSKIVWPRPEYRNRFLISLIIALLLLGGMGGYLVANHGTVGLSSTSTVSPSVPGQEFPLPSPSGVPSATFFILAILSVLAFFTTAYYLIRGYTLWGLRTDRSFSMIILTGTLVLPQLSAFPVRIMGWDIPTNASDVMALKIDGILHIAIFLAPLALISVLVGLWWNRREWLINAAIWYGLFTIFYTSVFTNGAGFFTGMVGSLGYWLEQQGVQRGSQPWYYYGLVQMPIYEYLPIVGTWLAFGIAIVQGLRRQFDVTIGNNFEAQPDVATDDGESVSGTEEIDPVIAEQESLDYALESSIICNEEPAPAFALFGFWAITSFVAYSIAGEKMPWLTVHVTLPAILCAAWSIGRLVDSVDWSLFRDRRGWLVIALLPVFVLSFLATLGSVFGTKPPFQGKELVQLEATSQFMVSFLTTGVSGVGIYYLVRAWPAMQFIRVFTVFIFAFMGFLTARVSIQANYYNYDYANELLVYAHSAPGVKTALNQIEEISRRTRDSLAIDVAYDNETSYPYWWYFRNYPNASYYGENPSRNLRDKSIILVGDANFGKIEPVVANLFNRYDYIRLWWPNQDYFGLTWARIVGALSDPKMREALFQIWLNRDYSYYGKIKGEVKAKELNVSTWSPAARMRLYIRKDITNQLWNYGAAPVAEVEVIDPFEGKQAFLTADRVIGQTGSLTGQFQHPRDIAIAPDGSLYVVDTDNHRIQHLTAEGVVMQDWGSFGDATQKPVEGGLFNQPWGIGLGPDGSVYVADTWNHRIQKFTADGKFLFTWGYFGQAEQPDAFWGPRDVAVNAEGEVFVTDTGNKRVVVFDSQGKFITEFGGAGMMPGQLDEPVGIAVDADGLVYIADTWNQRIQVYQKAEDKSYQPFRSWELQAWYGESLDNKPYLAVDNRGSVFVADPEGYRVLQFTDKGEAVRFWGDYGVGLDTFSLPSSVAVDPEGNVWVVDAGNNRLMHFILPPVE
jgi:DNA-binding beta-propeller fold protein YncE